MIMKKFVAGGDSGNKLFEVAYLSESGDTVGTSYVSVCAKDTIEAAEIVMNLLKVSADKIEYINKREPESVIA